MMKPAEKTVLTREELNLACSMYRRLVLNLFGGAVLILGFGFADLVWENKLFPPYGLHIFHMSAGEFIGCVAVLVLVVYMHMGFRALGRVLREPWLTIFSVAPVFTKKIQESGYVMKGFLGELKPKDPDRRGRR